MNAKGTECRTSQGPPCLLGPLPFLLELVLSPDQPLSAGGGRLRDAGLRARRKKKKCGANRRASVNRRERDGAVVKSNRWDFEGGQKVQEVIKASC